MKKIIKLFSITLLFIFFTMVVACESDPTPPPGPTACEHDYVRSVLDEPTCTSNGMCVYECSKCGASYPETIEKLGHDMSTVTVDATCEEDGYFQDQCSRCTYKGTKHTINAIGHSYVSTVKVESVNGSVGLKGKICENCEDEIMYKYVDNGYSRFGELEVQGTKLVSKKTGEVVQLIGISTHGLQWYPKFVDKDIMSAAKDEFNFNVFRFSLYTAEDGYCECSEKRKEELYQLVCKGIRIATELDCYAIVDWHMLGEEDHRDSNPLYRVNESKEFFDRITEEFKDYDNVLYEIMNEPCHGTTWTDCKSYAEQVIPVIRNNKPTAIVLCGCPSWSSDLSKCVTNPINATNIMYTFHFYAADLTDTKLVSSPLSKGLPIFVTEHGGMDADGNGELDLASINKWYTLLDANNISYVAWNLSNSGGDSAIMKKGSQNLTDFSDANLKPWGVFYKNHIKERLGLK